MINNEPLKLWFMNILSISESFHLLIVSALHSSTVVWFVKTPKRLLLGLVCLTTVSIKIK